MPLPNSATLRQVAQNGARFAAVGDNGAMATGTTGSDWNLGSSGVTTSLHGITWTGSLFVAVGASGVVVTSQNGLTWTAGASGTESGLWGVTSGGGVIVAVGHDGVIRVSLDGLNWNGASSGTSNRIYRVAYANGMFIAVGEHGTLLTSTNGTNWSAQDSGSGQTLYDVVGSGTLWAAVGEDGTAITSPDGATWTTRPVDTNQSLFGVTHNGNHFVAVGESGAIVTSSDGLIWSRQAPVTQRNLHGVTYRNAQIIAVGSAATTVSGNCPVGCATPVIVSDPTSITVCPGTGVTFSVSATGLEHAPSYQWRLDGVAISGADESSYSIQSTGFTDSGDYDCVVGNSCGETISRPAVLTVVDSVRLVSGPTDISDCSGSSVTVSVVAREDGMVTYQWYQNGAFIPGANQSFYQIASLSNDDEGAYTCTITNLCSSLTTDPASVTIHDPVTISEQPADLTVCEGQSAVFTVTATGKEPLRYRWRKDGVSISGASNSSFTIDSVTINDLGDYDCLVTDACGSLTSSAASLTLCESDCLQVSLPEGVLGSAGNTITVPVTVTDLTDLGIQEFSTTINYDATLLVFQNAQNTGTLTNDWDLGSVEGTAGTVQIDSSGTAEAEGSGTLLELVFEVAADAACTGSVPFTFEAFTLAVSEPSVCTYDGDFQTCLLGDVTGNNLVNQVDALQILSNNVLLSTIYDPLPTYAADVTCNGEITVDDAAYILSFNAQQITAFPCETTVTETPETGDTTLSLTDSLVYLEATSFSLPIMVQTSRGDVDAMMLSIIYDSSVIDLNDVTLSGTQSAGFSVAYNADQADQILIALAGASPLGGSGVLLNLKGTPVAEGSTDVTIADFRINEEAVMGNVAQATVEVQSCSVSVNFYDALEEWPHLRNIRGLLPLTACSSR